MTILGKMTSISISPKHHIESQQLSTTNLEVFVESKGRSGRAASLALPNNSLLDLYDKQQEQCNSIALLPSTNTNAVVRRHSSHCCPLLLDAEKPIPIYQQPEKTADTNSILLVQDSKQTFQTNEHLNNHPEEGLSTTLLAPPIPKRTFRGKITRNKTGNDNNLSTSDIKKSQSNDIDNYQNILQNQQQLNSEYNYNFAYGEILTTKSSQRNTSPMMFCTNKDYLITDLSRQYMLEGDQISDDDRMSLENSVFDESTPPPSATIKIPSTAISGSVSMAQKSKSIVTMPSGQGTENSNTATTLPIAASATATKINNPNDLSIMMNNAARRSYRSSSDSNRSQTTTDTGYISNGSEKNFSDFRSRFSSVDTQSSLDSCLTEKTIDSPMSKESFKIDSGHASAMNEYNNNNNNLSPVSQNGSNDGRSGKNLPIVPIRKPISIPPKIPPPVTNINGRNSMNTHTSSTRPIPPTPPLRSQQSSESIINGQIMNNQLTNKNYNDDIPKSMILRNKLTKNRPPPIAYPKIQQRQDSSISSDSFSMTSSPGYYSKSMEAPLLQYASKINKNGIRHQDSSDSFGMTASRYACSTIPSNRINYRQDSNLSSDSFSQTSSPGYNSKIMEAPLLPSMKRICNVHIQKQNLKTEIIEEQEQQVPSSPITKSVSTPASLQTIVRFQNGQSNMTVQHRIVERRKSSNPYISQGRLKFRLCQVLLNAIALLAIAGGLAAYFNAYPTIKFINKTIITPVRVEEVPEIGYNPAPGICLPIIVKFCQGPQIPYNYTVFPNYIGHFGQLEAQVDLEQYDSLVDVRCYELVSLFLCTLFVPKCGTTGSTVPPCRTMCTETMRRCGFFFDVFGLSLPEYLNCNLFKDFENPEECVGLQQVRDVRHEASHPTCNSFLCDQTLCIPNDYVCDGHLDCMDQTDESNCEMCDSDSIYCGDNRCMSRQHICDGVIDCPYGQDERNCIRLSERNGDLGKGVLEVYKINGREWTPACVKNWDRSVSPAAVCSMLGYSSVNATNVVTRYTGRSLLSSVNVSTDIWKMYSKKRSSLMKEFYGCNKTEDHPIANLTCTGFECGKVRHRKYNPARRIIGGSISSPGEWPFLAAILGGPEKIFYCAGVLIADQWVLTASHCIGNHSLRNFDDWTIQLGVTRRNSYTYYGQRVKVRNVIPHPQYNTQIPHDNDIALFQLANRVAFHEHLLPVCLPPPWLKELKSGELCTVIGWGKREDKNPKATYEPTVNEVQVPVIRREQCDEWLDNLTVSEGMICAGYEEGGKDACQGDSGGPLLCPYPGKKDKWFVGGIVSWGIMCAHPKLPGVYANVVKYIPWILDEMQKATKINKTKDNNSNMEVDYYSSYEKP